MKKKSILWVAALTAAASGFCGTETFVPDTKELAIVLPSGYTEVGGITIGSSEKSLTIGNPNALNRADRAIIRLNLMPFMETGRVKKAVLTFDYRFWGTSIPKGLKIEHVTAEQTEYNAATAIGNNGELHSQLKVNPAQPPASVKLDITKQFNIDLGKGFEYCTFRISDPYIDQCGNPNRKPDCILIPCNSIKLVITR